MAVKQPRELIAHWIETINTEGRDLTKWELDFMERVTDFFERNGFLGEWYEKKLEEIYASRTA